MLDATAQPDITDGIVQHEDTVLHMCMRAWSFEQYRDDV